MLKRIAVLTLILTLICPGVVIGATPLGQGFVEGYLLAVTPADPQVGNDYGSVSIETYNGTIVNIALGPETSYSIDSLPVKLKDIRHGMEIYGKLDGNHLSDLEAYSTVKSGYIQPGSKVVVGVISKIDLDLIEVRKDNGTTGTYYTTPATPISKQGQALNLDELYVGDRVKLYFDELDSNMVSRMEVQGNSVLVKDVYKATLKSVDETGLHLNLTDAQVLNNSLWQSYRGGWRVDYSSDLAVYMAGQRINPRNLKYYRGRSVYLVTKNVLGKDSIERMVIKSQYESSYSAQVRTVDWFSDSCELSNNKNLTFGNGTIVVKDGRLQDKFALTAGTDAFFVTETVGGQRIASLVYVYSTGVNNSNIGQNGFYTGRLSDIFEDSFWIKSAYKQENNTWQRCGEAVEFYIDSDTWIFNMDSKKVITLAEFVGGDYTRDEDGQAAGQAAASWYAYVYAMADRGACIAIYSEREEVQDLRTTTGTIVSVSNDDLVGWQASLKNCSDWSERKSQWVAKNANLNVGLAQAMIIKGGKVVDVKTLKAGERLYIIRNDFKAKVVLVK